MLASSTVEEMGERTSKQTSLWCAVAHQISLHCIAIHKLLKRYVISKMSVSLFFKGMFLIFKMSQTLRQPEALIHDI